MSELEKFTWLQVKPELMAQQLPPKQGYSEDPEQGLCGGLCAWPRQLGNLLRQAGKSLSF